MLFDGPARCINPVRRDRWRDGVSIHIRHAAKVLRTHVMGWPRCSTVHRWQVRR